MASNFEYLYFKDVTNDDIFQEKTNEAKNDYFGFFTNKENFKEGEIIKKLLEENRDESLKLEKKFYDFVWSNIDNSEKPNYNSIKYSNTGMESAYPPNFLNILMNKIYREIDTTSQDSLFQQINSVEFKNKFIANSKSTVTDFIKFQFNLIAKKQPIKLARTNGKLDFVPGLTEAEFNEKLNSIFDMAGLSEIKDKKETIDNLYKIYSKKIGIKGIYRVKTDDFERYAEQLADDIVKKYQNKKKEEIQMYLNNIFKINKSGTQISKEALIRFDDENGNLIDEDKISLSFSVTDVQEEAGQIIDQIGVSSLSQEKEGAEFFYTITLMPKQSKESFAKSLFRDAKEALFTQAAKDKFQTLFGDNAQIQSEYVEGVSDVITKLNTAFSKPREINKLVSFEGENNTPKIDENRPYEEVHKELLELASTTLGKIGIKEEDYSYEYKEKNPKTGKESKKNIKLIAPTQKNKEILLNIIKGSYTGSTSNIIGNFTEVFFTLLLSTLFKKNLNNEQNKVMLLGSNLNDLSKQMHVDVAVKYNDTYIGLQLKQYLSSAEKVRSIPFYENAEATFPVGESTLKLQNGNEVSGILSKNTPQEVIAQLNFLIVNDKLKTNFLEDSSSKNKFIETLVMPMIRYEDYAFLKEEEFSILKNNFYNVNGYLIPTSLIFQVALLQVDGVSLGNIQKIEDNLPVQKDIAKKSPKDMPDLFKSLINDSKKKVTYGFKGSYFQLNLNTLISYMNGGGVNI